MKRTASIVGLCLVMACTGTEPDKSGDSDDSDGVVDSDTDGLADTDTDAADSDTLDFDFLAVPETVQVATGTYLMGSPEEELGHEPGEVQHTVNITVSYEIGRYEVSQGQYEAHMGANPSYWSGCPLCAVESVTWHQAAAYTNALSEAEGLDSCYTCQTSEDQVRCMTATSPHQCEGYRLPTEAEWEFAARGEGEHMGPLTSGATVSTREDLERCDDALRLSDGSEVGDLAWYCGNSDATPGNTTRPFGGTEPNALGLYDVHGNVWELTNDWYREALPAETQTNPLGPAAGEHKVVRGGGWNSTPRVLRLAFRTLSKPNNRANNIGFRIARTLDVQGSDDTDAWGHTDETADTSAATPP